MSDGKDSVYAYGWGNNEKRATLKGRACKVVVRGRMNSILIEFTDNGQCEITSRHAVRLLEKARPEELQLWTPW